MLAVQAVRSGLFYLLYLGQTVILALVLGLHAVFVRRRTRFGWALAQYWGNSNLWLLRWVAGIRTRVRGAENIPPGPCILAAKHMSDWDIFAILPHTKRPAFIAKKELMDIPFFGWAAASYDTIRIDRALGGEAIPAMLQDAERAKANGCRIVIFPEGTRKAPLADPDYRYGIVRLYEALEIPVVPVALNSGLFWGRNSLVLWPGTADARFLPAIPPGLPADVFQARLVGAIETGTDSLIREAHERGLTHPLTSEAAQKLDRLKNTGKL